MARLGRSDTGQHNTQVPSGFWSTCKLYLSRNENAAWGTRSSPENDGTMNRADLRVRTLATLVAFASLLGRTLVAAPPATVRERTPMTPLDVAKTRSVISAAISPDGRNTAYTLVVPRDPFAGDDGPSYVELHVLGPDGTSRPFVTGKVNVSSIQWTPDGREIAYIAKRGDDKHASLYVLPIDGGESRRLLAHDASINHVRFRPDGRALAFLATPPRSKTDAEWREKGFDQEIYEEDWRPTKVWLAATKGNTSPKSLDLPGSAFDLAWSPDGKFVAVALAPRPLVDDSYMFKRIVIVDIDSGRIVERIKNPGKLGAFAFSPDGKHLAMISAADLNDPSEGRLMIAELPGDGTLKDLMPSYEAHVESFEWLDAETVAFVAAEGTETRVATVSLSGQRTDWIQPGVAVFHSLSLSKKSKGTTGSVAAALVGSTPTHPPEVFVLRKPGGLKRGTDSNPWLQHRRLAKQESIRFRARDGLELEGILIYPLNYQPGRRYPLILTVHGGPESHVPNGWVTRYAYAGQVGAARGFAVFYPNYRGSTGRGVAFSKMGQADAAGKEFEDLIDAIDHLVKKGLVERSRVGITGGSYGGYASAWGATYYSEHFAASVMFVGISDNVSKVGTTDIPEEMYLVHHRKRLWDDWDYFLERSPIRHVQKNRTPTLILHGKEDPRVHPSQSMELYRHLKTLKQAPVRLVFYRGEGHGNRKAAARFDYNVRMLRWMERYLQGPGGPAPPFTIDYEKLKK